MPDVLKQTLYWSGNPSFSLTDDTAGACPPSQIRAITAAESHDSSDATYFRANASGNGVDTNPAFGANVSRAIDTASASGALSFVRVKIRAQMTGTGDVDNTGTVVPRINGTNRGGAASLTGSYVTNQWDFTTDPADSLAWTNAKVNAQTWGVDLTASVNDTDFICNGDLRLSEFVVELWGPDALTLSPTAAGVSVAGVTPSLVPNAVALFAGAPATVVGGGTDPTLVPVSVTLALEAASIATLVLDEAILEGERNPDALVAQAAFVDSEQTNRTVRSGLATYSDQNLATMTTHTSAGNLLKDLGGLQGSAAINGTGVISGVKVYALVRATQNGGSVTTMRFGTTMGVKSLVTPVTVYATATPDDSMWSLAESVLITTGPFGQPFEWGTGIHSVYAAFVSPSWTFNAAIAGTARLDIAEAWVEVIGPVGSQPDTVELKQRIGNVRRIQSFPDTLTTE